MLTRLQSSLLVTFHGGHVIHLCPVHPLLSSLQGFCSNQFCAKLLNQKRILRHGPVVYVLDIVNHCRFCYIRFSRRIYFICFRPFQLLVIRQTRRFHDLVYQWLSSFRRRACRYRICIRHIWVVKWRQKSIVIQIPRNITAKLCRLDVFVKDLTLSLLARHCGVDLTLLLSSGLIGIRSE